MVSSKTTQEVFAICQPEKVSISSGKGSIPRLYGVYKKYLHSGQKNQSNQTVD